MPSTTARIPCVIMEEKNTNECYTTSFFLLSLRRVINNVRGNNKSLPQQHNYIFHMK